MASCSYCGTFILFGGVQDGELRFCNQNCQQAGYLLRVAEQVPQDITWQQVQLAHQGNCPKCGGAGPIDVHTSHTIWSALVLTSWRSNPEVMCRSCGIKAKLGGILFSGFLGWWGFPWGLIMTPIQIIRNIAEIVSPPDPSTPSAQLQKIVRLHLASQYVAANPQTPPGT